MPKYRFFAKETLKLSFFLVIFLFILSFADFFRPYYIISWLSLTLIMFSTLFTGYYVMRSIRKPFFVHIYFGMMALKYIIVGTFFGLYHYFINADKWQIMPVLILFAIYKVFEIKEIIKASRHVHYGNGES